MGRFLCNACICSANIIDFDTIVKGCHNRGECLCLTQGACCLVGEGFLPFGFPKKDIITLSLGCCECGLKKPVNLCKHSSGCLCCHNFASCPYACGPLTNKSPISEPVCAVLGLKIVPSPVGCFDSFGPSSSNTMER